MISIALWPNNFQPTPEVLSHIVKHLTKRVLIFHGKSDLKQAVSCLREFKKSINPISARFTQIEEICDDLSMYEEPVSKYNCSPEIVDLDGELDDAYVDSELCEASDRYCGRISFRNPEECIHHLRRIGLIAERIACYDLHIGPSLIGRQKENIQAAAKTIATILNGYASASTGLSIEISIYTRAETSGPGRTDLSTPESEEEWARLAAQFKKELDALLDQEPSSDELRWKIVWHPYSTPGNRTEDKEGERYIEIETVGEWDTDRTICWVVHHNIVDLGAFLLGKRSDFGRGLTKINYSGDRPSNRTLDNGGWEYSSMYQVTQTSNEFGI